MECFNCGSWIASDSRFCTQCGVRQQWRGAVSEDTCEIGWWKGYLKADFYARLVGDDSVAEVIARSPSFRWRGGEPPSDAPAARAAYEALVVKLVEDAWEPIGGGDRWYAQRFRRRAAANEPVVGDLTGAGGADHDS